MYVKERESERKEGKKGGREGKERNDWKTVSESVELRMP